MKDGKLTTEEIKAKETQIGRSYSQDGYRIIGWASCRHVKLEPHVWYSPDLEFAKSLARVICEGSGEDVEITKHIATVRRVYPTEIIESKDLKKEAE